MAKFKLKKGDQVIVIAGKDKGKTGQITKLLTEDSKVIVSGINMLTKNQKPSAAGPGGQKKIETPIHISNVALLDAKSKKATKVGYKIDGDKKTRIARKSGEKIA